MNPIEPGRKQLPSGPGHIVTLGRLGLLAIPPDTYTSTNNIQNNNQQGSTHPLPWHASTNGFHGAGLLQRLIHQQQNLKQMASKQL